jgi:hypothetical protein
VPKPQPAIHHHDAAEYLFWWWVVGACISIHFAKGEAYLNVGELADDTDTISNITDIETDDSTDRTSNTLICTRSMI